MANSGISCYTTFEMLQLYSWKTCLPGFKFLFIITLLQPECQFFVLYYFLKLETSTFPTIQLFAFPFAKLKPCQFYKVLIDWIIWILNSQFHSFNLILGKIFVLLMEVEVKFQEYEHILVIDPHNWFSYRHNKLEIWHSKKKMKNFNSILEMFI